MSVLSRNQMEQVIRDGGSVLHGGRLITRVEHLPTDADLAAGNPEQEALAATALEAQIAALQAQYDRLTQTRMPRSGQAGEAVLGRVEQGGSPLEFGTQAGGLSYPRGSQPIPPAEHPFVAVVGQELTDRLTAAGYDTPDAVAAASDEQLLVINGIGPATLRQLRQAYGKGGPGK